MTRMRILTSAAIAVLVLVPAAASAHRAGGSEEITVNGSVPTDRAHDAVRENGHGKHPDTGTFDDSLIDRNPNKTPDAE